MKVGVGLGSNVGDRLANLQAAIAFLKTLGDGHHFLVSGVYETEPVDCPEGSGSFFNAVAEVETALSPLSFLRECQDFERQLGRPDQRERNAPRSIDLDILYWGEEVIDSEELTVPHPRMFQRRFVVSPLSEIRPERCDSAENFAGEAEPIRLDFSFD